MNDFIVQPVYRICSIMKTGILVEHYLNQVLTKQLTTQLDLLHVDIAKYYNLQIYV